MLWSGVARLGNYQEQSAIDTWVGEKLSDECGNLQLELYADENVENICGISYEYQFNNELEKITWMTGFTLSIIPEAEWQPQETYLTQSVYGTDAREWVEDYEEIIEYRDDGRPDFFKTKGTVEDQADAMAEKFSYKNQKNVDKGWSV